MNATSPSRIHAPIAAGIAFAAFGIFGTLPVLLGLAVALGLDQAATTSGIFAVSMGAGLATIPFVLVYREPFSPFAPLGLEAAFWSLVAGLALAFLFERPALFATLRRGAGEEPRPGS